MATYTDLPTLLADYLYPQRVQVDVKGSAIEGGRNTSGRSQSIELSGGGLLTASYEDCKINWPMQYEYINWLGARLNGSFRFINVPIITDFYGPFPIVQGKPFVGVNGIPHFDETMHSDDMGYDLAQVYGTVSASASLNSGTISIAMSNLTRDLRYSDWFSINHPTKGWRAYRYWKVISKTDADEPVYSLAISPPLREAVTAGTHVEFTRPRFAAKFPSDFTLPSVSESFYAIQQSIQFEEAF